MKAISDVYKISADVLLETESDGNIDAVANEVKIGLGGFTAFGAPSVLVHGISVAG